MIRPLAVEDISAIIAHEQQVFGYSLGQTHYEQGFQLSASFGYVMEEETIQAALLCWQNESHAQIDNLYVLPEFQQRGLAKRLVSMFIDSLHERGINQVSLEVAVKNQVAIRLYESFGFVKTATILNYLPDRSDAFRMVYTKESQ